MAGVKQVQVTFDCAKPRAVAEFWKAVLGYVDPPIPPGFDSWDAFDASLPVESQGSTWVCQDPGGAGPALEAEAARLEKSALGVCVCYLPMRKTKHAS